MTGGTTGAAALTPILEQLRAEPSRTWSLIVTLYGDAVVPRGGTLWLGTLLAVFDALGIGGNVVRTAVSRLTADGWLERLRVGRNAFYRLAEQGQETFTAAAARVYAADAPAWDGRLDLVIASGPDRDADRDALEAAGFTALGAGIFLAPAAAAPPQAAVIRLRAGGAPDEMRRLARQLWLSPRLEAGYRRFLQTFAPLQEAAAGLNALDALLARLLLVHDYRRLVLRDPLLPAALLPPDWPGSAARALCARLYPALLIESEQWLDRHGLTDAGALPPPDAALFRRFRA
jgi:phenylacetic acid degradation operon negative regulatory protein